MSTKRLPSPPADALALFSVAVAVTVVSFVPLGFGGAVFYFQRRALVWPCLIDVHTHLDKGHTCERAPNPDGTFDGCNFAAKGPFRRCATVLTLRCDVNYLERGDGILSFARCRTEMKKCSHPCFGWVFCTYDGSRMDKVELRCREKIPRGVPDPCKSCRGRACSAILRSGFLMTWLQAPAGTGG